MYMINMPVYKIHMYAFAKAIIPDVFKHLLPHIFC